jgi:hypothetical protein
MSEKSILENALLQVQTLEEAVKQNAKGILASTMKQELNDLLKESLEEEEEEVKDTEMSEQPDSDEEETDDMSDDEANADDSENVDDLDNEDPTKGIDSLDSEEDGEELPASDDSEEEPSLDDELSLDGEESMDDEDDFMDMTGASDDEVLKVFKAMKPEDGIVVKKDGDNVEMSTGEDEYIIKLDGEEETEVGDEMGMNMDEMSDDTMDSDMAEDETLYEIELDEEEEEESKDSEMSEEEDSDVEKVEATEAARTKSNPHGNKGGANRAGLPSKKTYKAGSGVFGINEEVETLKKQNAEYKKALVLFKEKLNEVAVFNANLAYATRLFTEHSTTKQEKLNILKRFDSVSTMNESKGLFNTIKSELGTKTTVTETVVEKISNTPSTSSSQQVLAEAKAYENPQFKRMKDLMGKIK